MECLNCTACIDACDTVMIKLDRKPGLIRYASENELAGKPRRLARARTALTALAFSGLVAGFVAAGSGRGDLEVVRLRDLTLPAIERDAAGVEEVRHVIHLALRDRSGRERTVTIGSAPPTRLVTQHPTLRIGANRRLEQTIILFAPRTDAPFDSALEIREAGRLAATVPLRLEVR